MISLPVPSGERLYVMDRFGGSIHEVTGCRVRSVFCTQPEPTEHVVTVAPFGMTYPVRWLRIGTASDWKRNRPEEWEAGGGPELEGRR